MSIVLIILGSFTLTGDIFGHEFVLTNDLACVMIPTMVIKSIKVNFRYFQRITTVMIVRFWKRGCRYDLAT